MSNVRRFPSVVTVSPALSFRFRYRILYPVMMPLCASSGGASQRTTTLYSPKEHHAINGRIPVRKKYDMKMTKIDQLNLPTLRFRHIRGEIIEVYKILIGTYYN